ncbi:beta-klotho-like [Astyanax mexicanus]|uniref:Beta-klotho-like n=1 Tax=Astyanax mexicanus TaxID=7994 RepID=A0A8T2KY74_ASTMX|nr:beta-klotho-like [Astyanax mexicanus]
MTHFLSCPSFFSFHLSLLLLTACLWDGVESLSGDGKSVWLKPLNHSDFLSGTFPNGFLWGVGTSAFQTEGSWDLDGKGASVWDNFTRNRIQGMGSNTRADTASDSYALWEQDVEAAQYLGVNFYAFSLSWPRLFPDGDATGKANSKAVQHYRRLIHRIRVQGLEPVVTLFHWDSPQSLQEQFGGWKNRKMVEKFADYAAFCFTTFGRAVRYWITMHNPALVALLGYGTGAHAPGVIGDPADRFIVAHNLIRAHAAAWHIYDKQFRDQQNGQISITLGSHSVKPFTATAANVELCQKSMEAVIGWFAEPIHGSGDYPRSMRVQELIPEFTLEEKLWVRGTADFFSLAFGPDTARGVRSQGSRFGQNMTLDLRKVLVWVQKEYGDPRVLVAEGSWFSDASEGVEDTLAVYNMKTFINQVFQAVVVDQVKVFGYSAWSLVDGFEWNYGYSIRRGLFYIDFNQPQRNRVPKTTAQYYRQIVKDNGFPSDGTERDIVGRFPCDFQFGVADITQQVHLRPFSPQFIDPLLYRWNFSGDGTLRPVVGVRLRTRGSQCSDFLAIQRHIRLIEMTGSTHYRFGLDWPQLLPNGDVSLPDWKAVRYYHCLLEELQRKGIQTAVTLLHPSHRSPTLGLPGPLDANGGWANSSTAEAFVDYATFCYREFGSLVRLWITINEPNSLTHTYNGSAQDKEAVVRNLLLAHARAWKVYHTHYRQKQGATVSFAVRANWVEPANPFIKSHSGAVQSFMLSELGRFLDPFLGDLDHAKEYPKEDTYSACSGYSRSFHLPRFSEDERIELKGALDFIALNHFTTCLVYSLQPQSQQDYGPMYDPTWTTSKNHWPMVPSGLRRVLNWVKGRYKDSRPVVITATGIDDHSLHDDLRQRYIRSYLQEALKARELDGVDLRGFYVWNLQDHHSSHFGFFTASHLHSQPKASVALYRQIVSQRGFPDDDDDEDDDGDPMTSECEFSDRAKACWLCSGIVAEYKPLLFFGTCLTVSVSMLAGVIVTMVVMKSRRKRRMRATQATPQRIRRQQMFATQRTAHRNPVFLKSSTRNGLNCPNIFEIKEFGVQRKQCPNFKTIRFSSTLQSTPSPHAN